MSNLFPISGYVEHCNLVQLTVRECSFLISEELGNLFSRSISHSMQPKPKTPPAADSCVLWIELDTVDHGCPVEMNLNL
jgi:hypothetical protein